MLKGRLGLETARVPHVDLFGLLYLERGALGVEDGCLRFVAAAGPTLAAGDYQLPHQSVSFILLGPGSTVSHDALRLLAFHGTGLAAVDADGVRCYTAPPLIPDNSGVARKRAFVWADERGRGSASRGRCMPDGSARCCRTGTSRSCAGSRAHIETTYRLTAAQFGVSWSDRHYDRANPNAADLATQAMRRSRPL
jgi:CRISPR-associated protein Cas1